MSITFDKATTPTSVAGTVTSLSITDASTAGTECIAWVLFATASANNGVTAKYGAASMTELGTPIGGSVSGVGPTYLAAFQITSPGGGTITFTTAASCAWIVGSSISYAGEGSMSATLTGTFSGSGSATANTGNVASASGDLVTCALFSIENFMSAFSQTSREHAAAPVGVDVILGDAAGAATVSFTATVAGSVPWFAAALNMVPTTGPVIQPASATVTITGGTPTVNVQTAAVITITTGTPSIGLTIYPPPATISITGSTPTVVQSSGPLGRLLNKLNLGQSGTIQVIGDSTTWGLEDSFQSTLFGWPGRMAIAMGKYYNANVVVYLWNYPTDSAYNAPVTAYNAGTSQTITLYLGGQGGAVMSDYLTHIAAMLPSTSPDVLIINNGFNENAPLSTFTSDLSTFINDAQTTYCPNALVLVTTENATTVGGEAAHSVTFAQIFAAMLGVFFTGATLPLSPPLQESTLVPNVWVLDTQQAGQVAATLYTDGLHPIAPGYAEQAQFMINELQSAPQMVEDAGLFIPTAATVTITGQAPSLDMMLEPTSAIVTITPGTPVVNFTAFFPTSAVISIVGGTPTISGITNTLTPAGATITITTGTPIVTGSVSTLSPASAIISIVGGTSTILVNAVITVPAEHIAYVYPEIRKTFIT